jgi:hypothetical protein
LAKQDRQPERQPERVPDAGSVLLPTVNKPGTYEWCEEVVECMNLGWRSRETAERAFLAAVAAAVQYRIWETLAPPFPEEPYGSLEGLIRRQADPGQAENMQIAIRFSGVLEQAAASPEGAGEESGRVKTAALSAGEPSTLQASASVPGPLGQMPDRRLTEEEEIALGNMLLDQYAAGGEFDPAGLVGVKGPGPEYTPHAPEPAPDTAPRRTAAQRKRDLLERTHPDLIDAVQAGELTLKQAYVQAGIEKAVPVVDKMQKLWKTASEEDRDRFMAWLEEEEGRQRRREYEEDVYDADA